MRVSRGFRDACMRVSREFRDASLSSSFCVATLDDAALIVLLCCLSVAVHDNRSKRGAIDCSDEPGE